jgi:hypothetical protein
MASTGLSIVTVHPFSTRLSVWNQRYSNRIKLKRAWNELVHVSLSVTERRWRTDEFSICELGYQIAQMASLLCVLTQSQYAAATRSHQLQKPVARYVAGPAWPSTLKRCVGFLSHYGAAHSCLIFARPRIRISNWKSDFRRFNVYIFLACPSKCWKIDDCFLQQLSQSIIHGHPTIRHRSVSHAHDMASLNKRTFNTCKLCDIILEITG